MTIFGKIPMTGHYNDGWQWKTVIFPRQTNRVWHDQNCHGGVKVYAVKNPHGGHTQIADVLTHRFPLAKQRAPPKSGQDFSDRERVCAQRLEISPNTTINWYSQTENVQFECCRRIRVFWTVPGIRTFANRNIRMLRLTGRVEGLRLLSKFVGYPRTLVHATSKNLFISKWKNHDGYN